MAVEPRFERLAHGGLGEQANQHTGAHKVLVVRSGCADPHHRRRDLDVRILESAVAAVGPGLGVAQLFQSTALVGGQFGQRLGVPVALARELGSLPLAAYARGPAEEQAGHRHHSAAHRCDPVHRISRRSSGRRRRSRR
ncbi:hypothetical protein [Paractinoplanes hotanensis]|uniref:Uncharacterized protein n=1 Tax=Paractinoplanes hotanensis TaxID=2906497 RepID=A0ABT0XUS2_9ACTN|nr:hypothetical protein [Actinoplanes hotanensis]MCM4077536.1 hypothetical protein [Actinoplanes hotanensis]